MAAPLVHRDILTAVRDDIDQIVYTRAAGPSDIERFGASKVTDWALNKIIGSACRFAVSRAEDWHVPALLNTINNGDPLPDRFLRVVDDGVMVNGIKARRLSFRSKRMLGDCRQPTEEYPVYSFADCDYEMDDGNGAAGGTIDTVVWPDRWRGDFTVNTVAGNPVINVAFTGGTLLTDGPGGFLPDHLGMSIRVDLAGTDGLRIYDHYATIVAVGGANTVTLSAAPEVTGAFTGVFFDEQTYQLRERLKPVIVKRSAELALIMMGRIDMAQIAAQQILTIRPYLIKPA